MPEDAKAMLRDALIKEALTRTQEGIRLSLMAQRFENGGHRDMAQTTLDLARLNEVQRIKLRSQIDAIDGFV